MASSVRLAGKVRTDVAQRSVSIYPHNGRVHFYLIGQDLVKIIGIVLAFVAIIFSIPWQKTVK